MPQILMQSDNFQKQQQQKPLNWKKKISLDKILNFIWNFNSNLAIWI